MDGWRSAVEELYALRRAVDANILKGGRDVIARRPDGLQFRIVGVKLRKGVVLGQALSSGKWVEISQWDRL